MSLASIAAGVLAELGRIATALEKLVAMQAPQTDRPQNDDSVYGTRETAKLLELNEQTVRKYCRGGVFGYQTKTGRWVIRRSEIEHFRGGHNRVRGKGVA